ncbi:MAG: nucleotide sugar dehydrogenase [Methanomicrobiales archaeon]|nr:nucleotide sugar dehydrogenase [Methanomicrobiales archaeon]
MGYVGIPAAALFADSGAFERVLGFQRDSSTGRPKIALLNRGENPLGGEEPDLAEILARVVAKGTFRATCDFSRIRELDAVTVAIQTPFAKPEDLLPDFTSLFDGLRSVGKHLAPGMLVVVESTVTPGTTAGPAREILEEESGLSAGADFALAHAPERVMVGRLIRNIREHDRVIGGLDPASTRRAVELYTPVLAANRVIPMSALAAEVTKTAENAFRDLQIAAVNQLALYCEAMGVNVYDVREGIASLKGEGITRAILYPGAGVGGHCLPKDTYHMERGVTTLGGELDYPEGRGSLFVLAREINDFMPRHMAHLTEQGLARAGKHLRGSRVAILGWAFFRDTDDARNTPSAVYHGLLSDAGAVPAVHDPYVREYPGVEIGGDLDAVTRGADAIALFTAHSAYGSLDPRRLKALSGQKHPVVVDGRNLVDPDAYIGAGWVYQGIGRGDKNSHPIGSG